MSLNPALERRFTHPARVYWEDTDAGGIAYYANVLRWFERARTEYFRSLGVSQHRLLAEARALFVVVEARVRYHGPARLDDVLSLSVAVARRGRASLVVEQEALCVDRGEERLVATGTIRLGCVDSGTFRPRPIPSHILERLQ